MDQKGSLSVVSNVAMYETQRTQFTFKPNGECMWPTWICCKICVDTFFALTRNSRFHGFLLKWMNFTYNNSQIFCKCDRTLTVEETFANNAMLVCLTLYWWNGGITSWIWDYHLGIHHLFPYRLSLFCWTCFTKPAWSNADHRFVFYMVRIQIK